MNKQYYYLITSLPKLDLDDYKEPYRVKEFIAELYQHLNQDHACYVKDILLLNDNTNIIDCALGLENPWFRHTGNWKFEELKKKISLENTEDDEYLVNVMKELKSAKKSEENLSRSKIEGLVWRLFFKKMLKHRCDFMRRYFYFDLNLRNIISALNKRKFKIKDTFFLEIGDDSLPDELLSSQAVDFNLSREYEFVPALVEAFLRTNSVQLEKFIDQLRWDTIDEINKFAYFDIDVLLGYLLKLMIVERWIALDEIKGNEVLERLTQVKTEQVYK